MTIREDFISEIVKRVTGVAQPDRILLFGSAATGEMSPDSDIDVLVLESSTANTRNESVRLRNALRGLA